MKVLHIINSLKKGGAEGNLFRLCLTQKKKYKKKIEITILTLIGNGFYEKEMKKSGINIVSLGMEENKQLLNFFKIILKFRNIVKKINPDFIQTWMYHSNFISLFISQKKKYRIFWNIRHSELNFKISKKKTMLISMICGFFSNIVPYKIIYCSKKSRKFHEQNYFYSKIKSVLIDNGYSDKNYYPSNKLRLNFRKKNNIKNSDLVLGYAGRYAKQKNITSLLCAFSKLITKEKNIYLFMVGKEINLKNKELKKLVVYLNIKNKVFFLNEQKNLLDFYNGIDLLILVSHSESFPNVVAESMLCSTPVLSNDTGCAKEIINKYGFIISKNDDVTIIKNLKKIIKKIKSKNKKWKLIKKYTRSQIQRNFPLEKMSGKYFENWIF